MSLDEIQGKQNNEYKIEISEIFLEFHIKAYFVSEISTKFCQK